MDIATLLADARRQAGMSQRDLARRAGTSAPAICEYESGRRAPRVDTLDRLVTAAGAQLVVRVDHPDRPAVDVARNARVLADLLGLVDHLPRGRKPELSSRVLAREAR